MSSFSALKTAIQAAIKQNGNNEITGDILQEILLSIVSTLGDSAINTLETDLQNEVTTRGNDDTQLGNLITGIKNNIDNGYVYAGIATPSTTPVSGKVFYIATQAGTYTNLGNTAVKPGISILKYNGSTWSNEQVNYTDGGVFDVSAYNGGATYASLEALLSAANLSTIIPSAVRKGGMSIKFVQSSDNKYVQARCMAQSFTTDVTQWQVVDDKPVAESDNLVKSGGVAKMTFYKPTMTLGRGINKNDGSTYASEGLAVACTPFLKLSEGADLAVKGVTGSTVTALALYDEWWNFISAEQSDSEVAMTWEELQTAGAVYYRCSISAALYNSGEWYIINGKDATGILNQIKDMGSQSIIYATLGLQGKKVSLLGDSNFVYADNSVRYGPGSDAITDIRDTWWGRFMSCTGSVLEVNASRGSSSVTDNEYYGVPGFLSRVDELGDPDLVIFDGGQNEPPTVATGIFDPDKPIGELDTMVFADAFDKMIRLIDLYYDAPRKIAVIYPKTIGRLADVMKEICAYYGVEVIDLAPVGSMMEYLDNVHFNQHDAFIVADYMLEYLSTKDLRDGVSMSIKEEERAVSDSTVAGYLVDKNNNAIGKLMKNGSFVFFQLNERDKAIDELLAHVSTEIPTTSDVIKFLTDDSGRVIATIDNTGKLHVAELEADKLEVGDGSDIGGVPKILWPILGIVSSGVSQRMMVNDKTYNLINSFPMIYKRDGRHVESEPCITLYDDDSLDWQLPTSYSGSATADTDPDVSLSKRGGYASKLFPLILAFNKKYKGSIKGKVTCFEAAEGQRIGLTKYMSATDEFTGELNNNGQVLNKLIEHGEWEAVCHSMTARYTEQNYLVNGLDSEFANEVLQNSKYDEYVGDYSHETTCCYDTVTKKNYHVNESKNGWEELPLHYAKPYCAVSLASNSQLVINPTYSPKYQVDEWFRRADIARLPYSMKDMGRRVYANWGSSHSIWHIRQNLKYADYGFGGTAETNTIPVDTVVHRFSWEPKAGYNTGKAYSGYGGNFNLYTEAEFARLVNMIDNCVDQKGWSFLGNHNYSEPCENYYLPNLLDFTYPTVNPVYEHVNLYQLELPEKPENPTDLYYYDPDYPEEWIIPLKYVELQDIIGANEHDYINHPPARLEISSWDEWYPCPGTGMALLWDALRYAVSKGITFITVKEGFERFGNLLTLGFHFTNGEMFPQDTRLGSIPEETTNHCIIGADGSVRYESK